MQSANRIDTLHSMRSVGCRSLDPLYHDTETHASRNVPSGIESIEARILEIAELFFLLQVDGYSASQIFERIGWVYSPAPDLYRIHAGWDPLTDYLIRYVREVDPTYFRAGTSRFRTCAAIAQLWAELLAERSRQCSWPRPDMLEESDHVHLVSVQCDNDKNKEQRQVFQRHRPIPALDAMLIQTCTPLARHWRRLRARVAPGDELRSYSTGTESFALGMGSAGVALVRNARAIDYAELMMN